MPDSDSELIYELGVTRSFGNCDLGVRGLVSGWAAPEDAHVWNDGYDAILELTTTRPRKACILSFEGRPFLKEECLWQDISLYLNGFRLGFWRLAEAETQTLSVTVEPEQFFIRSGKATARCLWHMPRSIRPSDLGIGSDYRQLGFSFSTFTMAEKSEP